MKRILLLATAILTLGSCSKDPIQEVGYGASEVVCFTSESITRGTPVRDESQMTDIGVFCSYTGGNDWTDGDPLDKMFNRRLIRGGSGVWNYDGQPEKWNANLASDRYTFFAYAPYETADNGIVVNGSSATTGVPTLDYTVPTDVTLQPDLMVAVARKNIRPNPNPVALQFEHALTCVGFQIAGDNDKIKGIAVTGVSVSGQLSIDGGGIVWSALGAKTDTDFSASINCDAGQNYYTATASMSTGLMKGDGYLMMIPQTLDDDAKVVITKDDDSTVEVNLNSGYVWEPGKNVDYHITLTPNGVLVVTGPSDYDYNGGTQNFSVESHTTTGTPVAWIAEFSIDDGGTWTTDKPEWLTSFETGGPGGSSASQYAVEVAPLAGSSDNAEDQRLKETAVEGSAGSPVDLSMRLGVRNTANCYIVNAAGHYKLPLVYGNAIVDNGTNAEAYNPAVTGTTLTPFLRHDDQAISGPWIKDQTTPVDAILVWEDSPGLIADVDYDSSDRGSITFEVPHSTVAQGNAVIAVRDASQTILWSWHIWVTPLVDAVTGATTATEQVKNHNGILYQFMKVNLGLCTGKTITYGPLRKVKVRISQTGLDNPLSQIFEIVQNPGTETIGDNSPYWQWGRKDPMPPSNGVTASGAAAEKTIYGNFEFELMSRAATLGDAIQHPYGFFYAGTSRFNWCSTNYHNLWSAVSSVTTANDNLVVKTVYDPSPVGFTMPASNVWSGFHTEGTNESGTVYINASGAFDRGWNFYCYSQQDPTYASHGTTFYPAFGYRPYNSFNPSSVGTVAYYWTAGAYSGSSGYGLVFGAARVNSIGDASRGIGANVRCAVEKKMSSN